MHDLDPIAALGATEPRIDEIAGVSLRENTGLALASVMARRGKVDLCTGLLNDLIGGVPGPGQVCLNDPEAGFWIGPDQWIIGAPLETHEDLAEQLKDRFGQNASITEQTDAWACFDLQGDGMESVMELLCAIDIRRMKTGDATRTQIHHLGCYVIRRDPPDWVRILGPRASAGSLHHALLTAMASALE